MLLKIILHLIVIVFSIDKIFCEVHTVYSDINREYSLISLSDTDPLKVHSSTKGDLCYRYSCQGNGVSERKCEEYTQGATCRNSSSIIDSHVLLYLYNKTVAVTSKPGEFPYLALIKLKERNNCLGALISTRFVLTTASCATQNIISVSLGNFTYSVPIKAIVIHPSYKPYEKTADIALIELGFEVYFNDSIRPACLRTDKQKTKDTTLILMATVRENKETHLYSVVRSSVSIVHEGQWKAEELYEYEERCGALIEPSKYLNLDSEVSQICAIVWDGCQAISGSPIQIMTEKDNSCAYRIFGLASDQDFKCHKYEQRIFTRIANFVYWIESEVWPGE